MSIFLVYSPFQLIGVLEALYRFKFNENTVRIIYLNNEANNSLDSLKWFFELLPNQVDFVNIAHSSSYKSWYFKIRLLFRIKRGKVDKLFIGDIREDTMKLFTANLVYNELYHLDDGASTLTIRNSIKTNPFELTVSSNKYKNLVFKFLGLFERKNIFINWFSIFDFTAIDNEKVINHDFLFLKSMENPSELADHTSDNLYFIGSNLINAGVVSSSESYLSLLKLSFTKISASKITYFLHRHEDVNVLKVLNKDFDIEFISQNEPIEISLSKKKLDGMVIASFYSTALFTLNKLSDCKVLMVNIPEIYLANKHKDNTLNVQKYYASIFKSISI